MQEQAADLQDATFHHLLRIQMVVASLSTFLSFL
jgi:hypothetical protein